MFRNRRGPTPLLPEVIPSEAAFQRSESLP